MCAIEGRKIHISGQKITPRVTPPRLFNALDGRKIRGYEITVKYNGKGVISEEYDPLRTVFVAYSRLRAGDYVSGTHLWGIYTDILSRDDVGVGGSGRTSAHTGQNLQISGNACLQIICGYDRIAVQQHPRSLLLPHSTH